MLRRSYLVVTIGKYMSSIYMATIVTQQLQGRFRRVARRSVVPQPSITCLLRLHALHPTTQTVLLHRRSRQGSVTAIRLPTPPRLWRS